jgi:uncharacterized Fe-S cluster-containing radical SAM superfamily enzyme
MVEESDALSNQEHEIGRDTMGHPQSYPTLQQLVQHHVPHA